MGAEPEELPQASAAAWSPNATPPPRSRILALDELVAETAEHAEADARPAEPAAPEPSPEPVAAAEPAETVADAGPPEPVPEAPAADRDVDAASAVRFTLPTPQVPKPVPGLESNFGLEEPSQPDSGAFVEPEPPAVEPEPDPLAEVKFVLPPAVPVEEPEPEAALQPEAEPAPYSPHEPESSSSFPATPASEASRYFPATPEAEPHSTPEAEPAAAAEPEGEWIDRLAALRDVARKLRTAPDAEATLQFVVELSCRCTGSDAGMLTITVPENRQVVWGTALGAGPYIAVQLRAGGPSFGELVLTRMADAPEFESQDETFAELVAEYVAKAVGAMRRGTLLSEEQQDFIDRVTEELRSPLAGSVNLLQSVLDGQVSPEEAEAYVRRSVEDSARMLRLIDDLLHIARMRPPEPREMEAMPVGPWLRRAVEKARPRAEAAGHTLKLSEPDGAFVVKGVPAQLDLVIHHLLDNAIKFSEEPGPIDVSVVPVEGLLRICVADHGIGFDNSDASRMLDCFSRAINAEAARIPGAGVGLFLASEIVRGHGGRLWLESRRDDGTQAYAALPYDR